MCIKESEEDYLHNGFGYHFLLSCLLRLIGFFGCLIVLREGRRGAST